MAWVQRILCVAAVAAFLGGPAYAGQAPNTQAASPAASPAVSSGASPAANSQVADKIIPANTPLPPPDVADSSQGVGAYRIGPMDKLDISVFQVKDLTGTVDVDPAGKITLPLVGNVQVVGLTTTEVSKEIADHLRQGYVTDPVVTVTVKEAISQKVTVAGAVQKPGVYPISGYTTLTTAVALAQGTDPTRANEHKVRLIRTVNGKRIQASYNLVEIQRGKLPDPEVYGNDTIVVDNSTSRGILRDIATATPLFYLFSVW
jgi:polysaccharide export outer membrane protein